MSTRTRLAQCAALSVLTAALAGGADDPPSAAGRPKPFVAGKAAAAVWEEGGVWHVRVTSKDDKKKKEDRVVFTGRVVVEGDRFIGQFGKLEKAKAAGDADWVFPHADGRGFDFRFANFGGVDGVEFKLGAAATAVRFKVLINGAEDPRRVLIGEKGAHPAKAEFTLPVGKPQGKK